MFHYSALTNCFCNCDYYESIAFQYRPGTWIGPFCCFVVHLSIFKLRLNNCYVGTNKKILRNGLQQRIVQPPSVLCCDFMVQQSSFHLVKFTVTHIWNFPEGK